MQICFFTENYYKGGLDTFLVNLLNNWPDPKDQLYFSCNSSHLGLETIFFRVTKTVRFVLYKRLFTNKLVLGFGSSQFSHALVTRAFFAFLERILRYPVLFPWYVFTLWRYFRRSEFDRLMVVNGGYPGSLLCRAAAVAWALAGKKSKAVLNFHNSIGSTPW